uniref:Uncharacterized protein n=1 Tax=Arundo donax TaxID=35708 RepID=A0A0A9D0Q6_ARUDO
MMSVLPLAKAHAAKVQLPKALVVRARVARTGHQIPAPNPVAQAAVWMTATFGPAISAHMRTPNLPEPARLVTANIDSASQSSNETWDSIH